MRDHFRGADRPALEAAGERFALGIARQETGSELVARAGGVDDLDHRDGCHFGALAMGNRDRAFFRTGGDQHRHLARHGSKTRLEIDLAGQRRQLAFVDEQDVDHAIVDHRAEIVAVAIDHEAFRRGEGDLAPGLACDLDRPAHRAAGLFGIPQIAFEVENRAAGDQIFIERGGGQELACTKEGVHRPLAIGRHEDQHTACGRLAFARRSVEIDAGGAHVMAEDLAELVVGDLADEGALQAERGQPRQRVRRRTARKLARRGHRLVKFLGPRLVDQGHAAAIEIELLDQLLLARGNHVDHGIADGDHVVTGRGGFGHGQVPREKVCAPPSRLLRSRQASVCGAARPR